MRYGFKAQAERIALQARLDMNLTPMAAVDPWAYSESLGVVVLAFNALKLTQNHCDQLLIKDEESWSGLTLKEGGTHFVVVNPSHTVERQRNTLVHELSHIQLGHVPGRVDISASGLMLLSDYPDDQEQEADWLAGAILLPRDALHHHRSRGLTSSKIAALYGVSQQLSDWRLRMTGVEAQLKRRYG